MESYLLYCGIDYFENGNTNPCVNSDIKVNYLPLTLEQQERMRSENNPGAPWLPILSIHISSLSFQVKTRQSQSYKFRRIAQNSNFGILPKT